MLFSLIYWTNVFNYLVHHPPCYYGAYFPYPSYQFKHTVMKVLPILMISYYDINFLNVVLADFFMDFEYYNPDNKFGFYLGCCFYQFYHYSKTIAINNQSIINNSIILPVVFTQIIVNLLFKLKVNYQNLIIQSYIFTIVNRLYIGLYLSYYFDALAVLILGIGDLILLYCRSNYIPYKDEITMSSTYLHLYISTLENYFKPLLLI